MHLDKSSIIDALISNKMRMAEPWRVQSLEFETKDRYREIINLLRSADTISIMELETKTYLSVTLLNYDTDLLKIMFHADQTLEHGSREYTRWYIDTHPEMTKKEKVKMILESE